MREVRSIRSDGDMTLILSDMLRTWIKVTVSVCIRLLMLRHVCWVAGAFFLTLSQASHSQDFAEDMKIEVAEVSAKVGEQVMMVAKLELPDGYQILDTYNHRLFKLSSLDNRVTFDRSVVPAEVQGKRFIFTVGVTPTATGRHPINGLIRVGYFKDDTMAMVTLPLVMEVTGTE